VGEVHPAPPGKFAATLTIGPKGQIVIPKAARDMFGYKPGDTVLLMADVERGIAIMPASTLEQILSSTMAPPEEEK
jgi:AbrB family looped-hinge helix DNA binding protein